tara:strand:+ start:667 stop:1944 length:1278 start_codon:yes stop_codon:yes gene_type:complete
LYLEEVKPTEPKLETELKLPIFQVLGDRNYRFLWPAETGLQMARWMWMLVSGYMVLKLTDSAFQTALVGVAFTAPMLLGGVISGIVADAVNRKHVLLWVFAANALLAGFAGILVFSELIVHWHILAFSLLIGTAHTLDQVARRTFVADLVNRESLHTAFALDQMGHTTGVMIGPFIGGLILEFTTEVGFQNVGWCYLTVATFYTCSLVLVSFIRPPRKQQLVPVRYSSILTIVAEGFRAMMGSRALIGVVGVSVILNLAFPSHRTLIPVFAEKVLLVSPTAMGALGAAQGIGSILGSMFIASRRNIDRKSRYYYLGAMIGMVSLTFFGLSTDYPISFLALLIAGIGMSGFGAMQATMLLLATEEKIRGRVMGIMSMFIGVMPLGTLILGGLAEWLGPGNAVFVTAAAGVVLTGGWSYLSKEMRKV